MPIHDWGRVDAGVFHAFHTTWLGTIQTALNSGVLPPDFYALAEQDAGEMGPDVLYTAKRRRLLIRHVSDDRVVAVIENLSPGNKSNRSAIEAVVRKIVGGVRQGVNFLVVDVFRPTPRDPQGVHGRIYDEMGDDTFVLPPDKPLTLVCYAAVGDRSAYVEPAAVGDSLSPMPLFLDPDEYVNVPLEETYRQAYLGVPQKSKAVLEAA